jgi:hypothetical protein
MDYQRSQQPGEIHIQDSENPGYNSSMDTQTLPTIPGDIPVPISKETREKNITDFTRRKTYGP